MVIGKSQYPYRCFLKLFVTWCPRNRVLRLGRLVWARGQLMKGGYTAKLSLALTPKLFHFSREWKYSFWLVLLGVRLHYERSYGGAIC